MQPHKAEMVSDLLSKYLPRGYSKIIVERAEESGTATYEQWVRSVKSLLETDLRILNLLIEFAIEKKAIAEAEKVKLNELLTK